jgi:HD-GYP domain-containing protein (c-di-GMP phosphodiesterase class II)
LTEDQEIPFNVYIKAGERLLKVSSENQVIFLPFINKIKAKKIENVFIHNSEIMKYIHFNLGQINGCKSKHQNALSRARRVLMTFKSLYTCIEKQGASKEIIELLKSLSIETLKALKNEKNNIVFFQELMKDDSVLKYTMARTAFSVLISEELGWKSAQTLSKISIGSFLADLGLGNQLDLGTRTIEQMTDSEWMFFSDHTRRSVDLLSNKKDISSEMLQAVLHHHENCDGSGLLGMTKQYTYPLGSIIRVADEFVKRTFVKNQEFSSLWILNSLGDLQNDRLYNQEYVNALSSSIIRKK